MLIAFLADIHANAEALAACLTHAEGRGADRYVFLGDLVGYGADPGPVLDVVRGLVGRGALAVLGNHDLAVIMRAGRLMNADARAVIDWTRERLSPAQVDFLRALPLVVEDGGRLYVHANAWAPAGWEYIEGTDDAAKSLRATRCAQTFCGHVHQPTLYYMSPKGRVSGFEPVPGTGVPLGFRRRWLAIPGSVGQPRDGNPAAAYALLDDARSVLTWFRIPYDFEAAARKVRQAGLPERLGDRLEVGH